MSHNSIFNYCSQLLEQRKELQSLRYKLSKTDTQAVDRFSIAPVKNYTDQQQVMPKVTTKIQLPQPIPHDRNVQMKTPINQGINTAFVQPFPSKKSTPGSDRQKLSMTELLSSKPLSTLNSNNLLRSSEPPSRRLTIPFDESRRAFKPSSSTQFTMRR